MAVAIYELFLIVWFSLALLANTREQMMTTLDKEQGVGGRVHTRELSRITMGVDNASDNNHNLEPLKNRDSFALI